MSGYENPAPAAVGGKLPPLTGMSRRSLTRWAGLGGVAAAAAVLGVSELVALFVGAAGSPLFAVGSLVIDLAPSGVKEMVIAIFGTGDKAALLTLMGVLIIVLSGIAGIVELRRTPFGVIIFGVFGLIALIAVLTRAGASGLDGIPTVIGTAFGAVLLRILEQRLARWRAATIPAPGRTGTAPSRQLERRNFLSLAFVTGIAAIVVGTGARMVNAGSSAVQAIRTAITLPAAAVTEPAVPAAAMLSAAGISPFVTSNADFYRIDTALQIPNVNPDTWTLKITGMVENEISLNFSQLLAKPLEEHLATLTCVSNDVGGNLIGNALWLGYPIRELLAEAKPKAGADMVLSTSVDGFTAGTPLTVLQDAGTNAMLAVGMNGKTLPMEHGFPVRMVVPGLYGYVSATKWVVELKVTKFSEDQGYWTPRGWDALGPIKLASRIDTPLTGSSIKASLGTVPIAGVAWEQHVGIKSVEVRVDNGAWVEATLADSLSPDTWRQWVYRWPVEKGSHKIQVRATDLNGVTQKSTYRPPAPNGSEGWHSVSVTVT